MFIRYPFQQGSLLGYIVEQANTSKFFDFATKTFEVHSTDPIGKMIERWRDDDHDGDGRIDDQTGDPAIKFLRGVYANTAISIRSDEKHDPHGIMELDDSRFEPGEYYIYIVDRNEFGRVITSWSTTIGAQVGGGTSTSPISFNIPEVLDLSGTINIGGTLPEGLANLEQAVQRSREDAPTKAAAPQPVLPPSPPAAKPIPPKAKPKGR